MDKDGLSKSFINASRKKLGIDKYITLIDKLKQVFQDDHNEFKQIIQQGNNYLVTLSKQEIDKRYVPFNIFEEVLRDNIYSGFEAAYENGSYEVLDILVNLPYKIFTYSSNVYGRNFHNLYVKYIHDFHKSSWFVTHFEEKLNISDEQLKRELNELNEDNDDKNYDEKTTYRYMIDNLFVSLLNSAIYAGQEELVFHIIKVYPDVDIHRFEYTLTCSMCEYSNKMTNILLKLDPKFYVVQDGIPMTINFTNYRG